MTCTKLTFLLIICYTSSVRQIKALDKRMERDSV